MAINGSAGRNAIVVNGSSINGSGWGFSNWASGDTITFNGSTLADTLAGTTQNDRINGNGGDDEIIGGLGRDSVFAGGGDDTIRYGSVAELVAGEIINGGGGTGDRLVLEGTANSTYDFTGAAISGVEVLEFEGGGRAELTAAQVGGAGIGEFVSTLISTTVSIAGQAVSTAGVIFTNWDDASDQIWLKAVPDTASVLEGGDLAEHFFGSTQADTVSGGGGSDAIAGSKGADDLDGGDGDDRFSYTNSNEMEIGETVDGGAGIDTSRGGTHHVWQLALTSIEQLAFGFLSGTIEVAGSQIGSAAGLINTVKGGFSFDSLVVLGPAADLTGVVFTNFTGFDSITLRGQADAANSLTGSSLSDTIIGGDLDDTLVGGKGVDTIVGGLGKDVMTGGNQSDYFVFESAAEAGLGANRDRITDFSLGNDVIDLAEIDAITGAGDDAFTFIGEDAFTAAGQLRFFLNGAGNTVIQGNTDGTGGAEFEITLAGVIALTVDEFFL